MKLHNTKHRGLTLVELLVVLAILAVMTTLAVTMTDGLVDQGRYEATQRTMESVRQAICGDPNLRNEDGTPLTSGFIADLGRAPQSLIELYQTPSAVVFSGYQPATFDADVQVFFPGWRSYMQLPVQVSPKIADGWGDAINYVRSGPSSGVLQFKRIDSASPNTYDNLELNSTFSVSAPLTVSVKLNFTATPPTSVTSTDSVSVRVYSPLVDDTYASKVNETVLSPIGVVTVNTTSENATYSFSGNLPIGPKTVRAYVVDSSGVIKSSLKSQINRFHLPTSGRLNLSTLFIQVP